MTDLLSEASTDRDVQTKKWLIHYQEAGKGHPVVLLHGSGPGASGWSNFQTNLGALSEHFRVLAVDLPGWGRSETVTWDERNNSEALVLLLDELGIEKAAVIGNSMGGMTALQFAVEHPDRITHLVTMGSPAPVAGVFSTSGLSEGLKVLIDTYIHPTTENFVRLVEVMAYDPRFASKELAAERARNALANPEHLRNFVDGMRHPIVAGFESLASQLPQVATPTLVVHGRDDRAVNCEAGLRLVSTIENSRLLLLNRCGHWAQLEHADEFNRTVVDFIANH
jgi:2-hydroxy-6-oxonona-2,4-dienedioate hydrolase